MRVDKMLGNKKYEDETKPEKVGNDNGRKISRNIGTMKLLAICSMIVIAILVISTMAMSGVVKAEEEIVEEHGDMTAQLRPDFSELTYVVDQDVQFKEPFLEEGDWSGIPDGNLTDGYLRIGNGDKATLSSEDADINMTGDGSLYYEFRMAVFEDATEKADFVLRDSGGDRLISIRIQSGSSTLVYADGDSSDYSDPTAIEGFDDLGERLRVGIEADTDGNLEYSVYNDNYTLKDSKEYTNFTGNIDEIDEIELLEDDKNGYVNYYSLYILNDGSANTGQSEPDSEDSDYAPDATYDRRQEFDLGADEFKGQSGDDDINTAIGLSDPAEFEGSRYLHDNTALKYSAVTPENAENGEVYEKTSHFMGWTDLQDTIDTELLEHIAAEEEVSRDMVNIIDYSLDDLIVEMDYNQDIQEQIQSSWADTILEKAEEEGWELKIDGVTDDYVTVENLIDTTSLQKKVIDGRAYYGEGLVQNTKFSMAGMSSSSVSPITAYYPFEEPGPVKSAIMGQSMFDDLNPFNDYTDDIKDAAEWTIDFTKEKSKSSIQDNFESMFKDMRDRTYGAFGFGTETIGDIQEQMEDNIISDQVTKATEIPGEFIQLTNSMIGAGLQTVNHTMTDFLDYSGNITNGLGMSLKNMGDYMAQSGLLGAAGLLANGIATSNPFSLWSGNPFQRVIFYTVIVVIAVFLIAMVAIVWKSKPGRTRRR